MEYQNEAAWERDRATKLAEKLEAMTRERDYFKDQKEQLKQQDLKKDVDSLQEQCRQKEEELKGCHQQMQQMWEDIQALREEVTNHLVTIEEMNKKWHKNGLGFLYVAAVQYTHIMKQEVYIEHLTTQIFTAARRAREVIRQAEALIDQTVPLSENNLRLLRFIKKIRKSCMEIRRFHRRHHQLRITM